MNGGVLIAAGSSGMAQQPGSASAAYSVMASFAAQAAGTIVSLRASDGSDIATFAPSKTFANLVVCTPALQKGASYVLYAGGTCTGQEENGLYSGGEYSGGTELCSFTVQETCTVCGSGGFGGFSDGGHGKVPGGRR